MKKLLSMILALVMLLTPVLVMGETFEEYETYIDPNGHFTFSHPTSWTMISDDTFDMLWQAAEQQADEAFKATMENVKPQIKELGMIILMADDLVSNINIVRQETAGATPETLQLISGQLAESLMASLEGCEMVEEPVMIDIGNNRQALLLQYAYTMSNMTLYGVQAYVGIGDVLYLFTLTTIADQLEGAAEVLGFVLGSSELK